MLPFVGEQMQSAKKKEDYSAKKKRKERGSIVKKNFMMDNSIYGIHQFPNKTPIRETSSLKSITLFLVKFAHLNKNIFDSQKKKIQIKFFLDNTISKS